MDYLAEAKLVECDSPRFSWRRSHEHQKNLQGVFVDLYLDEQTT